MQLHDLTPGSGRTRRKKRLGQGIGTGKGKTSGKGHKGQKSRAGGGVRLGFEGGQMPLERRIPKRGFNNARYARHYQIVNIDQLEKAFDEGAVVDTETLRKAGMIKNAKLPVKVLGDGELSKSLTVKAGTFSASAAAKIKEANGKAEVV
ncbi:MAG: 50S ribosomal protein L15 [Synergistales bacterium]|nr:50S ribosomal protein L15 [Synergistales bacterium]